MKKKILLLALTSLLLVGCSKTELLYKPNAYNSPIFDENYYLERDNIDSLKIENNIPGICSTPQSHDGLSGLSPLDVGSYKWKDYEKNNMWGYHNNLDGINESFNYGILSKLYDGRVRCDGLYQQSRVQLNKTGYATYFPKTLVNSKFIAFACRGGTTLENPLHMELEFNFTLSFYIHITGSSAYNKITFKLNGIPVQTDNGGNTNLVSFYLPDKDFLNGAVAMSFEWECIDPHLNMYNLTDDYTIKEKDHLALMLYEVFIPQSTWL